MPLYSKIGAVLFCLFSFPLVQVCPGPREVRPGLKSEPVFRSLPDQDAQTCTVYHYCYLRGSNPQHVALMALGLQDWPLLGAVLKEERESERIPSWLWR